MSWTEVGGGFLGSGDHVGDVRVLGLPQWRGNADEDGVALRQYRGFRGGVVASGSENGLELLARNVGHVAATGREGRDAIEVGVEPDDREAGVGELDGQRKAHVTLADDGDSRNMSRDATAQRCGVVHYAASTRVQWTWTATLR